MVLTAVATWFIFMQRGPPAPGVVIGPGSLAQAHTVDEFVHVGELVRAVLIYRDFAIRMLGGK